MIKLVPRLMRTWGWMHLLAVLAVLLQPTTPPILFGRFSKTALLVLGGLLVAAPVVWAVGRWLASRIEADQLVLTKLHSRFILVGCGIGLFLETYFIDVNTVSYLVITCYLAFLLITLGIWALHTFQSAGWMIYVGPILGLVTGLVALALSPQFPRMQWNDNGVYLSYALGALQTHRPVASVFWPSTAEATSLIYYGQALWFSVFGVSFEGARVFTLVVCLISAGFLFEAARRAYSRSAAWIAVILAILAFLYLNFPRYDAETALFVSIALLCFVLAQQHNRLGLHFLTGMAIGFAIDGHANAYRFGIGFGIAYLVEYACLWRTHKRFFIHWPLVLLVLGGTLSLAIYIGLWSVISPQTFGSRVATGVGFGTSNDVFTAFYDQFYIALLNGGLLLTSAAGMTFLAIRRSTTLERLLIITVGVSVLIIVAAYGYYRSYYFTHSVPILALLAAGLYYRLEQAVPETRRMAVMAGLTALVFAALAGQLTSRVQQPPTFDQGLRIAEQIRQTVPKDARILANDLFYVRLWDYPRFVALDTASIAQYELKLDDRTFWGKINPDAVVLAHGHPVPIPESLVEYITDQRFVRAACWNTTQLALIELYLRPTPSDQTAPNRCSDVH